MNRRSFLQKSSVIPAIAMVSPIALIPSPEKVSLGLMDQIMQYPLAPSEMYPHKIRITSGEAGWKLLHEIIRSEWYKRHQLTGCKFYGL